MVRRRFMVVLPSLNYRRFLATPLDISGNKIAMMKNSRPAALPVIFPKNVLRRRRILCSFFEEFVK